MNSINNETDEHTAQQCQQLASVVTLNHCYPNAFCAHSRPINSMAAGGKLTKFLNNVAKLFLLAHNILIHFRIPVQRMKVNRSISPIWTIQLIAMATSLEQSQNEWTINHKHDRPKDCTFQFTILPWTVAFVCYTVSRLYLHNRHTLTWPVISACMYFDGK